MKFREFILTKKYKAEFMFVCKMNVEDAYVFNKICFEIIIDNGISG